ncbi:predicted nucleic acid-binding protein, containing PIN domain [Thermococcus kodakarensis KOD1]|uniref:Predicted nucleic acid-binding protein, containing PIN domain n=1 Tax=Thermococcus kodakarensis (strain ATCC BAA-918 / JCM 12380 / KOD1) TaxID=69014 RepID=Q5JFK5_THEKO|nr:type II toxin-antitoxin system VapC family toxin [Thermococcus kodakarensis]WCN28274.1 type II toxin-antitoxin system VapC family toxin [Thermococcus kodakarensis]WCN30569.1 type II toxin-antitoxin system VapC family toxin [Thermococcus kodakarensis]BAD84365.1 predicted nucleic acid-binding protein, containing PIN domain [Thermococcus kodakarensis KOD1]
MVVLDTNVVIEKVRKGEEISENITGVTFVEFPRIVRYSKFRGDVLFPVLDDFILAHKLQEKLLERGTPRGFADLLIAAICVNRGEELITHDSDFLEIAQVSNLRLILLEK